MKTDCEIFLEAFPFVTDDEKREKEEIDEEYDDMKISLPDENSKESSSEEEDEDKTLPVTSKVKPQSYLSSSDLGIQEVCPHILFTMRN